MKRYLLVAATALALSSGSVLAAGTTTAVPAATPPSPPVAAESGYYGYYSGYAFPDDGSPSGDQVMARPETVPHGPGIITRVYLFPPSEGSDAGGGPS
jgi:opacity protein-like surface antigen